VTIRTVVWLSTMAVGLAAGAAQAPPGIEMKQADDGSVTVATQAYQARLGPDGCLTSIRAGDVDFLQKHPKHGRASGMQDYVKPGHYGLLHPEMTFEKFGRPTVKPEGEVTATGPVSKLIYRFRPAEFDLLLRAKEHTRRFMLFPSRDVLQSLDLVTDRVIRLGKDTPIWWSQEGMRWVTRQGADPASG